MRPYALLSTAAAVSPVLAQGVNPTFLASLTLTLTIYNLTRLVDAVTAVANTTAGAGIFSKLSSGAPYSILAPNNDAFAGVNTVFANNITWLSQTLAYHIIPATVNPNAIVKAPNSTLFPTSLDDPNIVHLLPNRTQNIALQKIDGVVHISNQDTPAVVLNTTTFQNITVHVISAVVDLPPSLESLLTPTTGLLYAQNLTVISAFLTTDNLVPALAETKSITFFAPTNEAFINAIRSGTIGSQTTPAVFGALALNHVINGTIVTTGGAQTNFTSAGGQNITVGTGGLTNGTGPVVYYRGQNVANIVVGNIIVQSGIVHLIDAFLTNSDSNPSAASSAYLTATAASVTPNPTSPSRRNMRFVHV